LPSIRVDSSSDFVAGPNTSWKRKIVLALSSDGASSQSQQTLVIKVTALPTAASYRIVKTV
jgi:hypothetical protein